MTWLDLAQDDPFGLENLPYGVFSTSHSPPRVGVRIGAWVLDVSEVARIGRDAVGVGDGPDLTAAWETSALNPFLDLGPSAWAVARAWLQEVLTDPVHEAAVRPHLHPLAEVTLHLPFEVADFVDFDTSPEYARNMGRMFRPGGQPLPDTWAQQPIGYHGRAGTVVVSGTDIVRPHGQSASGDDARPHFGPTRGLDFEAELGYVIGGATRLGRRVDVDAADDHVFGLVLLNDWAARDLLYREYVPLGPFVGTSFATSISAWVVTTAALAAARIPLALQHTTRLPYLCVSPRPVGPAGPLGYDIGVEVDINGTVISRPDAADLAWSPAQLVAHLTVTGAPLRSGDLLGSGAISGPSGDTRGTLLDLTWGGQEPIALGDGSTRTYLEDGDVVTLRATARGAHGSAIGFGECVGQVVPAVCV